MNNSFASLLRYYLAEKKLTQRVFCQRVNLNVGFLHQVLSGSRPPPMDRVLIWASALGLSEEQTKHFELQAGLEHSPEIVKKFVQKVIEQSDS